MHMQAPGKHGCTDGLRPTKANDETKINVADMVATGISRTWKVSMQRSQTAKDSEGFYTATPLPALPTLHSSWTSSGQQSPNAQTQEKQQVPQAAPVLPPCLHRIQQLAHMVVVLPFSDPAYYGPAFLQAALALLLSVVLLPLGLALQWQSTARFATADGTNSPWAGMLYIVAAVPLLRLLMEPVACGMFYIGEVLVVGWPAFSKTPYFDQTRKLHRFSWLLVTLALLAWHSVVFKAVLQQPTDPWTGPLSIDTCAAQAAAQVRYACTHQLVYIYSLKVLCCVLLACIGSCTSALLGLWLLHHALAAQSVISQDGGSMLGCVRTLILQELYMALLSPDTEAANTALQRLRLLSGWKQHSASVTEHSNAEPPLQQQQHCQPQHFLHTQKKADVPQTDLRASRSSPKPAAAAACTALAALASLAVCGLAVVKVTANAALQPHIAVVAAIAVPASAAAAAGALAALAGMFTSLGCRPAAGVACSCFVAFIACAASVAAAVLSAHSAAGHLLSTALAATAGSALLVSAAAALLQLSAEQCLSNTGSHWCEQHRQRAVQTAAWQMLRRAMQRYRAEVGGSCSDSRFIVGSSGSGGSSSSWQNRSQEGLCKEGTALWRQLIVKIFPHRDPAKIARVSCADLLGLLKALGLRSAAAEEACGLFDANQDGQVTEADVKALVISVDKRQLSLATTLHNKMRVLMSLEAAVHVMIQVVLVVLYLAVFSVGTQIWAGTIAALALLLLGCVWLLGDLARTAFTNAAWLLSTNAFNVGDTISYNNSNWCVLHICLHTTTLECLSTGVPHSVPNSQLQKAYGLANQSRCRTFTAAVTASVIGMPAARLGAFIELLQAAAAEKAAGEPALYAAGSTSVGITGDKLTFNGSIDFVEGELVIRWQSACPGHDLPGIARAKAGMLQVVHEQYQLFLQPVNDARPISEVNMWSNPVYS